jgi:hypothetical protein
MRRAHRPGFDRSTVVDYRRFANRSLSPSVPCGSPRGSRPLRTPVRNLVAADTTHLLPHDRSISDSLALRKSPRGIPRGDVPPPAESMRVPILELGSPWSRHSRCARSLTQPFEISRVIEPSAVSSAEPLLGTSARTGGVSIPSVRRSARAEVRLEVEGGVFRLGIDNDSGRAVEVRPSRDGIVVTELPRTGSRGARLYVSPVRGSPPRSSKGLGHRERSHALAIRLALLATLATSVGIGRLRERRLGLAAGSRCQPSPFSPRPSSRGRGSPRRECTRRLPFALLLDRELTSASLVFGAWVRFYSCLRLAPGTPSTGRRG